jgi:hypothetical protein
VTVTMLAAMTHSTSWAVKDATMTQRRSGEK